MAATKTVIRKRWAVLGIPVSDADLERFRSFCEPQESGCIVWTGSAMWKGYGRFHISGRAVRAHRFSWALSGGDIPAGLQIDHLCRNRLCVNPLHLEPVTAAENLRRSPVAPATANSTKRACPKGHPYSGPNLVVRRGNRAGARMCRECHNADSRRYAARKRGAA